MIFANFAAFSGMGSPEGAPHFILIPLSKATAEQRVPGFFEDDIFMPRGEHKEDHKLFYIII